MVKTCYMEQRGATDGTEHSKFFRLIDDGTKVVAHWGAIGAKGQQKVLVESPEEAVRQSVWEKKFREKTKRKENPYVVIEETHGNVVERIEARPTGGSDRGWGLEVETHTNLSITDIADAMRLRGLEVNVETGRYFHSTGSVWDVKRDGSCGYEFASPILSGEAGIFDAKVAVEKIREVCSTAVNQQCGIHVTIGVSDHSDTDLNRLMIGYLRAQDHFFAECAAWRQDNRYCKRNPISNLGMMVRLAQQKARPSDIANLMGGHANHNDRYHGLNLTRTFVSPKVVEFRMLESTVAVRKVGAWIRMCVGFVDGLKKSGCTFKSTTPFAKETFDAICAGTWTATPTPAQRARAERDENAERNEHSSSAGYGGWGHDD